MKQAEDYTFEIRGFCRAISAGTKVGRALGSINHNYLVIRCRAHYVVYTDDRGTVTIIRILHQRMNITAHLR